MTQTGFNKRRLIKNTILLYGRMVASLLVNLYCSRVVLQALGVVDYGVYEVVGGAVLLFTFFASPLSASTSRFLTFEVGTQNKRRLKEILSASILIHLGFALLVCLLAETIGIWLVSNVLVIPTGRLLAAFWVLQTALVSMFSSIMQSPFRADVIAHERMDAFAVISLSEVFLKLILVLCLAHVSFDKLVTYGFLMAVVSSFSCVAYWRFCQSRFEEAQGDGIYQKEVARELLSFMGWMLTGGLSGACTGQGVNMLLNVFFGPAVNAARGIALQVQSALINFSSNIQQALSPQITITYANRHLEDMHRLMVACPKYTFYFLFFLSLPIYCFTPGILALWLGDYPPYTVEFVRVVLVMNLIEAPTGSLIVANHATGRVKIFQICVELVNVMVLPLAFLYLRYVSSESPVTVYYIALFISLVAQCVRIAIVLPNIGMRFSYYFQKVILPCGVLFVLGSVFVYFVAL